MGVFEVVGLKSCKPFQSSVYGENSGNCFSSVFGTRAEIQELTPGRPAAGTEAERAETAVVVVAMAIVASADVRIVVSKATMFAAEATMFCKIHRQESETSNGIHVGRAATMQRSVMLAGSSEVLAKRGEIADGPWNDIPRRAFRPADGHVSGERLWPASCLVL